MNRGFIKLYRKFAENPIWRERRVFSRAECWIDILLEVRHSEEPAEILIKNKIITCKQGQSVRSIEQWAARWGMPKSRAKRVLDLFVGCNMISVESVSISTRLTVLQYSDYNDQRYGFETDLKQKRNGFETGLDPNNNVNNVNTVKNGRMKDDIGVTSNSCPEPKTAQARKAKSDIQFDFESGKFLGITDQHKKLWAEAYPALGIDLQIARAGAWLIANPKNKKSNYQRFLINWLSRAQDGARATAQPYRKETVTEINNRVLNEMFGSGDKKFDLEV